MAPRWWDERVRTKQEGGGDFPKLRAMSEHASVLADGLKVWPSDRLTTAALRWNVSVLD